MIKNTSSIFFLILSITAVKCFFASESEVLKVDACDAMAIALAKLDGVPKHSISSAKLVMFDDKRLAWRIQYAKQIVASDVDPDTLFQVLKFIYVYMDGSFQLHEKKGIPRKRVILPHH